MAATCAKREIRDSMLVFVHWSATVRVMQNTRKVILFLAIALVMFTLSILFGARKVSSLIPGSAEEKVLDAAEYTEGASFDAFLVKDGRLYDVYSLTPESLQAKDCPT